MSGVNPNKVLREHEIQIRVRYQETDAQGHVHHANYLNYFELGRVEMLRASGYSYREFEESGPKQTDLSQYGRKPTSTNERARQFLPT